MKGGKNKNLKLVKLLVIERRNCIMETCIRCSEVMDYSILGTGISIKDQIWRKTKNVSRINRWIVGHFQDFTYEDPKTHDQYMISGSIRFQIRLEFTKFQFPIISYDIRKNNEAFFRDTIMDEKTGISELGAVDYLYALLHNIKDIVFKVLRRYPIENSGIFTYSDSIINRNLIKDFHLSEDIDVLDVITHISNIDKKIEHLKNISSESDDSNQKNEEE